MAITEERIAEPEKLSDRLSTYFCNKCGYLGKEGPAHLGCNYHAARDRAYQMALDLEAKLEEALRDGDRRKLALFDYLEWIKDPNTGGDSSVETYGEALDNARAAGNVMTGSPNAGYLYDTLREAIDAAIQKDGKP